MKRTETEYELPSGTMLVRVGKGYMLDRPIQSGDRTVFNRAIKQFAKTDTFIPPPRYFAYACVRDVRKYYIGDAKGHGVLFDSEAKAQYFTADTAQAIADLMNKEDSREKH